VFLVSHDRTFLDNVVTSTIAFEGDGRWREYEGGVQDWLVQSRRSREFAQAQEAAAAKGATKPAPSKAAEPATPVATPKKKLSFKEQRELQALPELIESLEQEQAAIAGELADGSLYAREPERASELGARNARIEDELLAALERWEQLGGS
jgi:ATP-binding cassette subfamily F protein uup